MIIAVDFDGTIVEHDYPRIGKEIPFAIETLKKIQRDNQHLLVLWTVREGKFLQEAVDYCHERGLDFYAVNKDYPEEQFDEGITRKIKADLFIDDRNLGGLPDWGIIYAMIMGKVRPTYGAEYEIPKPKNIFIRFGEWLQHS